MEGRRFGKEKDQYELQKKLGKGGQAQVYECKRLRYGNFYAAKIFHIKDAETRALKNLEREVRNMRELCHPNIVNLIESFYLPPEDPSECILLMDLAQGGDLCTKVMDEVQSLKGGFRGLGGDELCSSYVAQQLLGAIGYMHEKNIIHRDLKPENILICNTKVDELTSLEVHFVKIADLGLSMHLRPTLQRTTTPVGTLLFAAPEVLYGDYDAKADFWSLGVIVYNMLCGCNPFEKMDKHGITRQEYEQLAGPECLVLCKPWNNASEEAKIMVRGLLTVNPQQRWGLHRCLQHGWSGCGEAALKPKVSFPPRMSPSGKFITGVVQKIRASMGAAVDNVTFELCDDSTVHYGATTGGEKYIKTMLQTDELVIAVMQEARHNYLGNAIVFYTSLGEIFEICGWDAQHRVRFAAPSETGIVGLQFRGSSLTGIHLKDLADGGSGAVEKINGKACAMVDEVTFHLRNGKTRVYPGGGAAGGQDAGELSLDADESVIAVEQVCRDAYLGRALIFYTSKGQVKAFSGLEATVSRYFAVSSGRQICGLEFDGSHLARVITCSKDGDLSTKRTQSVVE